MERKNVSVLTEVHKLVDQNRINTGIGIARFFEDAAKEKLARQAAASENFHPVLSTATEVKTN